MICQRGISPDHPPIYVVNGVALGLRADGTVDHAAAAKMLGQINVRAIVSIEVLKNMTAIARFGPAAHQGVVLITASESNEKKTESREITKP